MTVSAGAAYPGKPEMRAASGDPTLSIRKSCDFCYARRKKCDGDGVGRCSYCARKGQTRCVYGRRQKHRRRSRPQAAAAGTNRRDVRHSSIDDSREETASTTSCVESQPQVRSGEVVISTVPLKSIIRNAMTKIMLGNTPKQQYVVSHHNGGEEKGATDFSPTASNALAVQGGQNIDAPNDGAQVCSFWCAVALGALAQGRPTRFVERYLRLAGDALEACSGDITEDTARANTIMAYLCGYTGTEAERIKCIRRAICSLSQLRAVGVPVAGIPAESLFQMRLFAGRTHEMYNAKPAVVRQTVSICSQAIGMPQIGNIANESDVLNFFIESTCCFGKAFLLDLCLHQSYETDGGGMVGETKTEPNPDPDPVGVESLAFDDEESAASRSVLEYPAEVPLAAANILLKFLRNMGQLYERLQQALDRPRIRNGVGGLLGNVQRAMVKAASGDVHGAVESAARFVEVLVRFPGLALSFIGVHAVHCMALGLACMESRPLYDRLRDAYNAVCPHKAACLPPIEEWQGIGSICNSQECRSMQRFLQNPQFGLVSSASRLDGNANAILSDDDNASARPVIPSEAGPSVVDLENPAVSAAVEELMQEALSAGWVRDIHDINVLDVTLQAGAYSGSANRLPTVPPEPGVSLPSVDRLLGEHPCSGSECACSDSGSTGGLRGVVASVEEDDDFQAAVDALAEEDWLDVTNALLQDEQA